MNTYQSSQIHKLLPVRGKKGVQARSWMWAPECYPVLGLLAGAHICFPIFFAREAYALSY